MSMADRAWTWRQGARLVFCYLLARWKLIFTVALSLGVCLLVEVLYGHPLEAYGYACLLVVTLLFLLSLCDFARFVRRHLALRRHLQLLEQGLPGLPGARNLIEEDFRNLALELERRLRRAESLAEQERSELLAYYTLWMHQVKTPIAALKLLLERDIRASTELKRIEQYVEMALSYLKLDEVSQDFLARECPIKELATQAIKSCSLLFIEKGLRLELGELSGSALTDEKWLCFVLEQLLSSAAKYTPAGGCVRVYRLDGAPCTLVVEDNGIGIRAEDIPHLGEKGFTGYNGHEDKRSTGLGLYLCTRVMARLGHRLRFESQLGQGTKAYLELERQSMDIA